MNSELENKVNYLYDSVKAEHISTKELYHGHFIDLIEEELHQKRNIEVAHKYFA